MRARRAALPRVASFATLAVSLAACVEPPPPSIDAVLPNGQAGPAPGGRAFVLRLEGEHLDTVRRVRVGAHLVPAECSDVRCDLALPPLARGQYPLVVENARGETARRAIDVANTPPSFSPIGPQAVLPGERWALELFASDFDGDSVILSSSDTRLTVDPLRSTVELEVPRSDAEATLSFTVAASDGLEETSRTISVEVLSAPPPLRLDALHPLVAPGGFPISLDVLGRGFTPGCEVLFEGAPVPTSWRDAEHLSAHLPSSPRGLYTLEVVRGDERSAPRTLQVRNAPPLLVPPDEAPLREDIEVRLPIRGLDLEGDPVQLTLHHLPPGARFDSVRRELVFRPDFIQGGRDYPVRATLSDGEDTREVEFHVRVTDTIRPPWPAVVATEDHLDHQRLVLAQATDAFLDSPGNAGRTFEARVSVPRDATARDRRPVRIYLHGFGGQPYAGGQADQFRIYPHDPENTYWWGYSSRAPGRVTPGPVPPYTARRVLHLLEWVLARYPGADPERVYVTGTSMGGTGAATLGLLWARHFAFVEASIGQKIARNHRPSRAAQLSDHYGRPQDNLLDDLGIPVWDRLDLVRALAELPEAREQYVFSRHAKDDPIIHFGAAVHDSPRVGKSWLEALQSYRVGHLAIWDEGAHGPPDPVMGKGWWTSGHDRVFDEVTFYRRNLAFVAFSQSSMDDDPGDGSGNGARPWNPESGFAGDHRVPGDTGWAGDLAGAFNRHLRFDARTLEDTVNLFSVPLQLRCGDGAPPPRRGYPSQGDHCDGPPEVRVDVTPRRTQAFRPEPREQILWRFGAHRGEATADESGVVTIEGLRLTTRWERLVLERSR